MCLHPHMPLCFHLCTHHFHFLLTFFWLLPVTCRGRTLAASLGYVCAQLVPPHQDQALQAETTHCLLSKQSWGQTLPTGSADAGTLQLLPKYNLITVAEEFFSILSGSFTVLPHSPLCLLSLSQYLPF